MMCSDTVQASRDSRGPRLSNLAGGFMLFGYGLFSIAAQTLLFREFLGGFKGSDISVAVFFACWFLWVGLGAIVVRRAGRFAAWLADNIELVFLTYLPAFVLEAVLIIQVRRLAGIEAYALMPLGDVLLLALLVTAPVSIITGMFFPLACQTVGRTTSFAVRHVYMLEAAGSFVGGLGTTLLLSAAVSSTRIFLLLALVISLSASLSLLLKGAVSSRGRLAAGLTVLLTVCIAVGLLLRADDAVSRLVHLVKWRNLFAEGAPTGAFQTPQAEYLYGQYGHQWVVVREGSAVESLPDETSAGRTVALTICQKPDANSVLVVGSGLALCREFLTLPQLQRIVWAGCDNEYVRAVNKYVPAEFRITDERFEPFAEDVRSMLAAKKHQFDLVIINLPDPAASAMNRYFTVEFYRQISNVLRPNGVVAVAVAGGENIMGTEMTSIGASAKLTLEEVFPQIVLAPGDQTWFIASASSYISDQPGVLRDRFAQIEGTAAVFPPAGLLSVYLPDRAAKAMNAYRNIDLPRRFLINRDARPLAHLYALLLAAKQSDAPLTRLVKLLLVSQILVFLVPIIAYCILRPLYILRSRGKGTPSAFDSSFLVFSTGLVGIGVVIVLMYLYQTRYGSLYLHVGAISSLYMAGLTLGAAMCLMSPRSTGTVGRESLFVLWLVLHAVLLVVIGALGVEGWTHGWFAGVFVLCGICNGRYFPLAARQLDDIDVEPGRAAAALQMADHLGAAAGALLTGLLIVPVLGTLAAMWLLAALLAANIPAALLRAHQKGGVCIAGEVYARLRPVEYTLFAIAAAVIICSNLLAAASARLRPSLPDYAAQALAGAMRIERTTATFQASGRAADYFLVYDPNGQRIGYVISSQGFAPQVRGFGGKMNIAIYINGDGKLVDFTILSSNETPAYLEMLAAWFDKVRGHQLFQPAPFTDVAAVTGATISSNAVLSAIQESAKRFAAEVVGRPVGTQPAAPPTRIFSAATPAVIYLAVSLMVTLAVILRGGFWTRLAVLAANLLAAGVLLNIQYSSEQIASLLSGQIPAARLSAAFVLILGAPLLAVIFGNIYCGYLCPFGVLQELLGYVFPSGLRPPIAPRQMQNARLIKYVVLFVLIVAFFVTRDRTAIAADPLISIFSFRFAIFDLTSAGVVVAIVALAGSIFYPRFWCRYLCPAGAFLSLFNNFAVLGRFLPAKRFARCEFGVTAGDRLDCIYCDRCRPGFARPTTTGEPFVAAEPKVSSRFFAITVVAIAVIVSAVSLKTVTNTAMRSGVDITATTAGGQSRDVDARRIEKMIRDRQLSDREADFYKKVE